MTRMAALVALALYTVAPVARAEECVLGAAEWSRPRSGEMVLGLAPVADCVRAWQRDPAQRLVLVHAPGEEGSLWAVELRDWLIALGVPSSAVDLRAVGTSRDAVVLRVEPSAPLGR